MDESLGRVGVLRGRAPRGRKATDEGSGCRRGVLGGGPCRPRVCEGGRAASTARSLPPGPARAALG